ncbi:MAG: hypothetical protein IT481_02360, partial [Gammaproteobacteria bacterium]|nr:hypothetical protein [Gammaproteobacteria bacterium]
PDLTKIAEHRGEAYLKAYMRDPPKFYDERRHRRLMPRQAYLEDAVTVHVRTVEAEPATWVEATLARHPGELARVRRQFESLRPERLRLRRQPDGDEPDLDACVQGRAELRAGGLRRQDWYESRRPGRRSLALLLLVDASGSTDGWIDSGRRVIDVEREAALLVGHALEPVGMPFAIAAYSGEGPHGVVLRLLKTFDEAWRDTVALRIGGLEPERLPAALLDWTRRLLVQ